MIVEVKAVEKLTPIHRAQLLTYLKLTGHRLASCSTSTTILLKHGMRRILNG